MASLQRRQKREYSQKLEKDMKNPQIQKIMKRYFTKVKEFEEKGLETVNILIKDSFEGKIKMSSTDKQALHDAYKKLLKISLDEKVKSLKEEKNANNESTQSSSGESQTNEDLQGSSQDIQDSTESK